MIEVRRPVKLDSVNRKIISVLHMHADITNVALAERVGLSRSACFARVKALKDAGYFVTFVAEIDMDRVCEHVFAYVEFTLADTSLRVRQAFEERIKGIPEFMDCFYVSGDVHYISYTCCASVRALNGLCDELAGDEALRLEKVTTRVVLNRAKWHLGYPLSKLKWFD